MSGGGQNTHEIVFCCVLYWLPCQAILVFISIIGSLARILVYDYLVLSIGSLAIVIHIRQTEN